MWHVFSLKTRSAIWNICSRMFTNTSSSTALPPPPPPHTHTPSKLFFRFWFFVKCQKMAFYTLQAPSPAQESKQFFLFLQVWILCLKIHFTALSHPSPPPQNVYFLFQIWIACELVEKITYPSPFWPNTLSPVWPNFVKIHIWILCHKKLSPPPSPQKKPFFFVSDISGSM